EPETALGEDLRVGVANRLLDGLRHHRAAVNLLQMADRHLAGTEAIEANLVLEIHEARVRLGIKIGRGNADLKFVLQSLSQSFCDLHGINLLPLGPTQRPRHFQYGQRRAGWPAPVVRRPPSCRTRLSSIRHANAESAWCGRRDSNPHNFRPWNLNPARLPVPPRPLIASCPAARPRAAGLITWARRFAAKKWPKKNGPCEASGSALDCWIIIGSKWPVSRPWQTKSFGPTGAGSWPAWVRPSSLPVSSRQSRPRRSLGSPR